MIYKDGGVVLLITKDRDLKSLLRIILRKFKNTEIIVTSDSNSLLNYNCVRIIFLDTSRIIPKRANQHIKDLRGHYIAVPLYIIVDERSRQSNIYSGRTSFSIEGVLDYKGHLVIQKPVRELTIESILVKHTARLRDNSFKTKKYHGLTLNEEHEYATYNGCKIFLSEMECCLLSFLMKENCILKCSDIRKAFKNTYGRHCSLESVRICIHRTRKKFKNSIGLNIIGNKHGVGYFLKI